MKTILSFVLLVLASLASAKSATGNRLLAIFEDVSQKSSYSKFLGDLENRGFQISIETPKTENLALFRLGERAYDHVVFFPNKVKALGSNLTPNILVDFINAKGNVLVALSSETATSNSLIGFLSELDIQLPTDRTGLVVDHFNYDAKSASELHDVLVLPAAAPIRPGVKDLFGSPSAESVLAFPRGVGAVLGPGELLSPVLRAPSTAYSYNPKEQNQAMDDLFAAGPQLSLVTAFQARNSARLLLLGSAEMLQDKWFDAKVRKVGGTADQTTYNRDFAKRASAWAFQELGVLKVNWVEHRLNEKVPGANETNPGIYRVKNDVTYTISMSEWSYDKWTGFTVPAKDALQLEFSMLSPFHRLDLSPDATRSTADATAYTVSFRLPDQHGIFNFHVNYRRPLLTNVDEKNTVSVRHMAHDEWPRSYAISGAWPWIMGIGATITGWLGFVVVWMFSKPVAKAIKTQSKKTL